MLKFNTYQKCYMPNLQHFINFYNSDLKVYDSRSNEMHTSCVGLNIPRVYIIASINFS